MLFKFLLSGARMKTGQIEMLSDMCPSDCDIIEYRPVKAWLSVAILLLFSLLSILDRQIISLQVDPIRATLGLTDTELGVLQGFAFALVYALAGLPLGWAIDHCPRRVTLHVGITLWSLCAAATGLAGSFWQIFLARMGVGIGEAVLTPAALSLISDLFPKERAATPLGVFSAGFYLGSGAALAIGGYVVSLFPGNQPLGFPLIGRIEPWQAVFIVTGLPGVLFALLAYLILDTRRPEAKTSRVTRESTRLTSFAWANRGILAISFVGFGLSSFVAYAIGAWAPTYYTRIHGLSPMDVGPSFGLIVALAAPGAILGGTITDRLCGGGHAGASYLVAGCATIAATPFLIAAFAAPDADTSMITLSIGMAIYGFTAPGIYSTFRRLAPPRLRGQLAASFVLFHALLGAGFAPIAVGFSTDFIFRDSLALGKSLLLVLGVALPTMSGMLFWGWKLEQTRTKKHFVLP